MHKHTVRMCIRASFYAFPLLLWKTITFMNLMVNRPHPPNSKLIEPIFKACNKQSYLLVAGWASASCYNLQALELSLINIFVATHGLQSLRMRVSPGILQAYNASHRACSHTNYMSEILVVGLYLWCCVQKIFFIKNKNN